MDVRFFDKAEVAKAAADFLSEAFKSQREHGQEFLFLSSGGSSLQLLDLIDTQYFGPHSTVAMLDERFSTDPLSNNFAQLEATEFYRKAKELGTNFINTKIQEGESMEEAAMKFETALRNWFARSHDKEEAKDTAGKIIATVGVGPDTHTSGVMPFPENPKFFNDTFNDDARWVAAYDAENKNPERLRITCTLPLFRKIDLPVLFITGENKRDALSVLNSENGLVYEHPCRIWREIPQSVLFTDQQI